MSDNYNRKVLVTSTIDRNKKSWQYFWNGITFVKRFPKKGFFDESNYTNLFTTALTNLTKLTNNFSNVCTLFESTIPEFIKYFSAVSYIPLCSRDISVRSVVYLNTVCNIWDIIILNAFRISSSEISRVGRDIFSLTYIQIKKNRAK